MKTQINKQNNSIQLATKRATTVTPFKRSTVQLALATSMLIPALANANINENETISSTETMVITANRAPQSLSSVLNSVKVFTRDDIEISSAQSVAEILNNINGIQLSQNGGAGQNASLFTRGTNSGHTLVVIDGQRVSSATLGQVNFAAISPEQIERIEVIKGPRAALWGSDAIGGVIQIFTRQLSAGEVIATVGLGNEDQQQSSLSTAISHGNGSTTFSASARSTDGYDVLETAEEDDDGYSREDISIVGSQTLNEYWRVKWLGKYSQGLSEYDNAFDSTGANKTSFESYQWQTSIVQMQGNFSQEFILGKEQNKNTSYGNSVSKSEGSLFKTTRIQTSWLGNYQFNEALSSTLGIDFNHEEVDTSGTQYTETERDNTAIFVRTGYDKNGLIIDASIRYDDIENIDSEVTYNASVGHTFADNSLISLNVGSGFKAPSFNDLYYPSGLYSKGNPDLVSETSDTIELLIKHSMENIQAEISIFQTKIDDLIEWVSDPVTYVYSPENIAKAKIKGAEVTLNTQLFGFDHQVQWAYLDAKNDDTNERLIRRAKNTASYHITKQWDKFSLVADVKYEGKRLDTQWPSTVTLPSHTLVNFGSSYKFASDWTLNLKMNNVFDKDYVSANNYAGQPRQYLLSVTYQN